VSFFLKEACQRRAAAVHGKQPELTELQAGRLTAQIQAPCGIGNESHCTVAAQPRPARRTQRRDTMDEVMSACGVICSGCAAYLASSKGLVYQKEVAEAWKGIYGFDADPARLSCGGCLSPDDQVYPTSVKCTARRCCLNKGLNSCAECSEQSCDLLAKAQSNWDAVPEIGAKLSASDFEKYAQPYCGYRERFEAARREFRTRAEDR
jgi:hypothetical protein